MGIRDRKTLGPQNPHPLSLLRNELVWEGKYDEQGCRRVVDLADAAIPLELIEAIDDVDAGPPATLFAEPTAWLDDFRNLLLWADNKQALTALLSRFRGQIDLIYIDPPFDVGADFTMDISPGSQRTSNRKIASPLEMVAYRDIWGRGPDTYLHMMYERLVLLRELLSERGTIYVHCDGRVNFLLRAMLDELFGRESFRNEIAWCYRGGGVPAADFAAKHDTILRYTKTADCIFHVDAVRIPYSADVLQSDVSRYDKSYRDHKVYEGYRPNQLGKHPEDWWPIQPLMPSDKTERLDYPTQKPVELLQRIVDASSDPESIVLDAFAGSGTTLAVAEGLRVRRDPHRGKLRYHFTAPRRWIGIDVSRFSLHTIRKRLVDVQRKRRATGHPGRAFGIFGLGAYERRQWHDLRLGGDAQAHRRMVLESYRAIAFDSTTLIHGCKDDALCHVGDIDAVLTAAQVGEIARAARDAGATAVTCLAWQFAADLQRDGNCLAAELGLTIRLIPIPREILERNRTEPPLFLELAALEAEPIYHACPEGTLVDVRLTRFQPSLAELPAKQRRILEQRPEPTPFDFIDFWAVDFDYNPAGPFHHHWQDFRTRKDRTLATISQLRYRYPQPGRYTACVKVVDIFGGETTATVNVELYS